ncbi:MAG: PKD domain-containing protein [Gammaproteobacteria bacterium]|nr:PKD domain-containing protein [Gammaproteobacteria bacterium]
MKKRVTKRPHYSAVQGMVAFACLSLLSSLVAFAVDRNIGGADGGFENGFTGMFTEGDAQIVTGHGPLLPTQGSQAALLTNQPDAGPALADVDESRIRIVDFTIPAGVTELRLDYNFLSNEPNPSYMIDRFTVRLLAPGGEEILLQEQTFEPAFPSVWTGYERQTGFRLMRADVSAHAGGSDPLTLEIELTDDGDGRVDSAVLLDNLHFADADDPTADAGIDFLSVEPGVTFPLNAAASTDNGIIVSYEWDMGNGDILVGPAPVYAYDRSGLYQVTLTVTDDDGNLATDTLLIVAGDLGPTITSSPLRSAYEGVEYHYQVKVADPEVPFGDLLTYSLTQAPAGMTVDTSSGLITWLPTGSDPRTSAVEVRVEDSRGLSDGQSFDVTIGPEVYVIATRDDGRIYYSRSNGDGTFTSPSFIYDTGQNTRGAAIADFDHDGDFDLITGHGNDAPMIHLYYYEKEGGDFEAPVYLGSVGDSSHSAASWLMDMAAGDFNNDGEMDFAVNGDSSSSWLFTNHGELVFDVVNFFRTDFAAGDDGWGGAQCSTAMARDDSTATSGAWSMRVYATGNNSCLSTDINPSGWSLANGSMVTFDYRIPAGVPVGLLFNVSGHGWIYLGGSPAASGGSYDFADVPKVELVADDQWHTATFDIYKAIKRHWPDAVTITEFQWWTDSGTAPASTGQAFWFDDFRISRRNYLSGFAISLLPDTGAQGRGLDAGDADGDGNRDLVRGRYSSGYLHLYLGDGDGDFTTSQIGDVGNDPYGVVLGDFDNDGLDDVIAEAGSNGDPYFYKGNGNGTFQTAVYIASLDTGNHTSYGDYDLNNDGNLDIVAVDYSNRDVWFYPGNGDATFASRIHIGDIGGNTLGVAVPAGRVFGQPIALATQSADAIDAGGSVDFDAGSSYDDGTIVNYLWDFGDGSTAMGVDVSHSFVAEGIYTVVLTVTDDEGFRDRISLSVTVTGNPPVADPGGPYLVGEDAASNERWVQVFDGSGSSDPDSSVTAYEWTFGDGLVDDFDDGDISDWTLVSGTWEADSGAFLQTDETLSRAIAINGDVVSGDFDLETDLRMVSGTGVEGMLVLMADEDGGNRYEVILRGRGNNDVLFYRYVDGSGFQRVDHNLSFTVGTGVDYHLKVERRGTTFHVYLDGDYLFSYTDATHLSGRTGVATYLSHVHFDNIDLTTVGSGINPPHVYHGQGSYDVTLTVFDEVGLSHTATTTATVTAGDPPLAAITGPVSVDETAASHGKWVVGVDLSGSSDDHGITRYLVDWGDGSPVETIHSLRDDFEDGDYNVNPTWTVNGGSWSVQDGQLRQTDTSSGWKWLQDLTASYRDFELEVDFKGLSGTDGYLGIVFRNANGSGSTDSYLMYSLNSWDQWRFYDWRTDTALLDSAPGTGWNAEIWYHLRLRVENGTMQLFVTPAGEAESLQLQLPVARHPSGGIGLLAHTQSLIYDNVRVTPIGDSLRPMHLYTSAGSYDITLTVMDHAGQASSMVHTVSVETNSPPLADAGGPYLLDELDAWDGKWDLILDAGASSDDHQVQYFSIDFGDGQRYDTGFDNGFQGSYFVTGTDLYGYDIPSGRLGRIVATQDGTEIEIINLNDYSVIASNTLDQYGVWDMSPGDGIHFKVQASKPVTAYLTDFGNHSAFMPMSGGDPVGRRSVFHRDANQGFYVFAYEDAIVNFYDASDVLRATQRLNAGTYWEPAGLSETVYRVVSSGDIAIQTVGANGYTTVPAETGSAVGRLFYAAIFNQTSASVAVFAYETADVEIFDMDTGESLHSQTLAAGEMWYQDALGTRRLRIVSSGDVEVWAGSTEGGSGISYLGDDISVTGGREGIEFHLHQLMDGIVIFAPNDGTDIDINGGAMTSTLDKDGYWHLEASEILGGVNGVHHITASKPVIIQTLGRANAYNDVGSWLGGVSTRHRYLAPDTYTVTVTAVDRAGQIHSAMTSVEVTQGDPPVAVLVAPDAVDEGAASGGGWSVDFDASGSSDDVEIIRYEWDFGDGTTTTGIAPSHVYTATGTYTVTLTAIDRAGQRTAVTHAIEVRANAGPTADAGGPYEFGEQYASYGVWHTMLDASGSTDDFGIHDYLWTFDPDLTDDFTGTLLDVGKWRASPAGVSQDGKLSIVGTGSTWGERYLFNEQLFQRNEGMRLQARIKVVDASGAEHAMWGFKNDTDTFHYAQMPYALYFHDNRWIYVYENGQNRGNKVTYTKGVEYDVRITLKKRGARYEIKEAGTSDWTLIYDSSYSYEGGLRIGADVYGNVLEMDDIRLQMFREGPVISVDYRRPQVREVTLRVRDHALQESFASTTVTINDDGPPVAAIGGPYQAEVGSLITFDGSGSSDATGIQFYDWTFGDTTGGPDDTGNRSANLPYIGKGARPQHFYQSTGTYDVTLTVTDNAGNSDTATTTVDVVVGDPPVADAGGPYEAGAGGPPAYFDGRNSSDDFGIVEYRWDFDAGVDSDGDGNFVNDIDAVGARPFHTFNGTGTFFSETFTGTLIDSNRWLTVGAVQDDKITLTGGGNWGTQYLFSHENFRRGGSSFRGQIRPVNTSGDQFMMWGLKNTSTNYSYTQMPHAIYFRNGDIRIYENGNYRGQFANYTRGDWYEVRIDMKEDAGATYYYRALGASDWIQIYDSTYDATETLKVGVTMGGAGTFEFDNFIALGQADAYVVTLTVEDGAGQTSTDTTTVTAPGNAPPDVITVPWVAHDPITPHETYNGKQIHLKGIVRDLDAETFQWDFGDGTSSAVMTVSDSYDLSVTHTYPDVPEGTPFVATLRVWDTLGQMGQDTYNVVVKPKNLTTEINVAIDEGLWFLHQRQTRTTTNGYPSGWWKSYTYSGYYASAVAAAIQSFEINGHFEYGDHSSNPYVETVDRGLKYLFSLLTKYDIAAQTYGEPDTNGNGIGLSVNSGRPIYEGGPVMDAIASSRSLLYRTVTGGDQVNRRSYFDVLTDMADQFYWGQDDDSRAGGWRYGWNDFPDNSAAQWGAIGLKAAQDIFGIPVPGWVKERNNVWLNYSYDGTGFGYTGSGNGRATTPSGMVQLAFNDFDSTDSRWATAEDYIGSVWSEDDSNSILYGWNCSVPSVGTEQCRDYYAMYAFTKAMRLANPEQVIKLAANGHDWFEHPDAGIARILIDDQTASGRFQGSNRASWDMRSAWAVIMLSRTLFVQPPVADAGRDRVWAVNLPLEFDGSGSYHLDPFRSLVRYEWDFDGDGVFDSVGVDPVTTHTYPGALYPESSLPQTLTATLRVTDNNVPPLTSTDTVTITIAVPPHPPVADANGPYTCTAGLPCTLDGSGSFDIDPTDFIARYEWELDVLFPYDFGEASGATPSYVWAFPGTYNIGLRVWDNGVLNDLDGDGEMDEEERLSDQEFVQVRVEVNEPPIADAGGPYTVDEGGAVTLDGSGSSDPNGDPLIYGWDFDNDGAHDDGSGVSPLYISADDGSYPLELQVSDGLLIATAGTLVTVNNVAPTVDVGPDQGVEEGSTVNFAGGFSDPGILDSHVVEWDFGDGSVVVSGTLTPSHVFVEDGSYKVTLVVTDDDGGAGSDTLIVTVGNLAPVVTVPGNQNVTEGDNVVLAAAGFTDAGTTDTHTATVDWGDGVVESAAVTESAGGGSVALGSHVYPENGVYTVAVTVTDDEGAFGRDTLEVTVNNAPPVVEAGADQGGIVGNAFVLDPATFTDVGVEDTHTATIDWGDGTTESGVVTEGAGSGVVAGSHVYQGEGTYRVTVTVTDDEGASGSDDLQITVTSGNVAPTAAAGGPYLVDEGQAVILDGSGSNDPDGGPQALIYAWDLDGDGQFNDATGVSVTLPLQPDDTSFTVGLRVSDGALTDTDTASVTVNNVAPVVDAGADRMIDEGGAVNFSGGFTDPGSQDTHTIEWNFGDGTTEGGTLTPSHLYPDDGLYTVTLTVTDKDGGVGSDALTVTVNDLGPTALLTGDGLLSAGQVGSYDAGGSSSHPDVIVAYEWDWSYDGVTFSPSGEIGVVQSHTWSSAGDYLVAVRVIDEDGSTDVASLSVTVEAAAAQTIFDLSARPKPGEVFLTWTPVAGAESYNIYRSSGSSATYILIASGHTCDYCAYQDMGLSNGVTYHYVVTSVQGGVESLYSNEASATPVARSSRSR